MPETRRHRFAQSIAIFCAILLLAAGVAGTAFAQGSNGSVRGIVRDQSGAVIPGAAVELTNDATNVTLTSASNEAGLYVFGSVIPGKYTLKVSSPGMETQKVAVEVQVQTSTTFNAMLKAGSTGTTVTVSADVSPLVVEDSPALGHVLERQRIEQLPINGRDIQQLLVTVPGLEVNNGCCATNQVRSFGMQAGAHQYILDGAVLEESMWNEGTIYAAPGLDTIQEFKVENNSSSAKYTRMTSIVMSTKSGTNQFHGSAFETNRNNAYGKARTRQDYGDFPELSRNEFGGTLGGPVRIPGLYNGKDRTFFFTSYEGRRFKAPNSMTARVPTAAMRNGDFSGLLDSQDPAHQDLRPEHHRHGELDPPAVQLWRQGQRDRSGPHQPAGQVRLQRDSDAHLPRPQPAGGGQLVRILAQ